MSYSSVDLSNSVVLDCIGYNCPDNPTESFTLRLTNINGKDRLLKYINVYIFNDDVSDNHIISSVTFCIDKLTPVSTVPGVNGYVFSLPLTKMPGTNPDTVAAKCFYSSYRDEKNDFFPATESLISAPIILYHPPQTPTIISASLSIIDVETNPQIIVYAIPPLNTYIKYNALLAITTLEEDNTSGTTFQMYEDLEYTIVLEQTIPKNVARIVISLDNTEQIFGKIVKVSIEEVIPYGFVGELSDTQIVVQTSLPPTNFDISGNSNDLLVNLSWTASSMQTTNPVDYYQIYRITTSTAPDANSFINFPLAQTTNTSYTDLSNITIETEYFYAISAINIVNGVTYESDLTFPLHPSVFINTAGTPYDINLQLYSSFPVDQNLTPAVYITWNNDFSNVDISYNILTITNNTLDTSYNINVYVIPNSMSNYMFYTDVSNINIFHEYNYKVSAVAVNNGESLNAAVSENIKIPNVESVRDLTATVDNNGVPYITWSVPTTYDTSKNVLNSNNTQSYLQNYTITYDPSYSNILYPNTETSFTAVQLPSNTYTFDILSNGLQNTFADASLSFTVPNPSIPSLSTILYPYYPLGSTYNATSTKPSINVSWTITETPIDISYSLLYRAVYNGLDGSVSDSSLNFELYPSSSSNFYQTDCTYQDTDIDFNKTYYYRAVGVGVNGSKSEYSNTKNVEMFTISSPKNLSTSINNSAILSFTWAQPDYSTISNNSGVTSGSEQYLVNYTANILDSSSVILHSYTLPNTFTNYILPISLPSSGSAYTVQLYANGLLNTISLPTTSIFDIGFPSAPTNTDIQYYPAYTSGATLTPAVSLTWTTASSDQPIEIVNYVINRNNVYYTTTTTTYYTDVSVNINSSYTYSIHSVGVNTSNSSTFTFDTLLIPQLQSVYMPYSPSLSIDNSYNTLIQWDPAPNSTTLINNVSNNQIAYINNYKLTVTDITSSPLVVYTLDNITNTTLNYTMPFNYFIFGNTYSFQLVVNGLQNTSQNYPLVTDVQNGATPLPPKNMTTGVISNYVGSSPISPAVYITWNAPSYSPVNPSVSYFIITRSDGVTLPNSDISLNIDTEYTYTYTDYNVSPNITYDYTITSYSGNNGTSSEYVEQFVQLIDAVTDLKAVVDDTSGNISFSWTSPQNASYNSSSTVDNSAFLTKYSLLCVNEYNTTITFDISNNFTTYTYINNNTLTIPANYTFRLISYGLNNTQNSVSISGIEVITRSAPPKNLTLESQSGGINLYFNNPDEPSVSPNNTGSNTGGGTPKQYNVKIIKLSSGPPEVVTRSVDYIDTSGNYTYNSEKYTYQLQISGLDVNTSYSVQIYLQTQYGSTIINGVTQTRQGRTRGLVPFVINSFSNLPQTTPQCYPLDVSYNSLIGCVFGNTLTDASYSDIVSGYFIPAVPDEVPGAATIPVLQPIDVSKTSQVFKWVGYNSTYGNQYQIKLLAKDSGSATVDISGGIVLFDNANGMGFGLYPLN